MAVSWLVVPIGPEVHELLKEHGIDVAVQKTRFPTFDELTAALETLELPIRVKQIKVFDTENLFSISVGDYHSDEYAYILGTIEGDEYDFHFYGAQHEHTMIKILKAVSEKCGALVICDDYSITPLVVDVNTNIEEALIDWDNRWKERNPE